MSPILFNVYPTGVVLSLFFCLCDRPRVLLGTRVSKGLQVCLKVRLSHRTSLLVSVSVRKWTPMSSPLLESSHVMSSCELFGLPTHAHCIENCPSKYGRVKAFSHFSVILLSGPQVEFPVMTTVDSSMSHELNTQFRLGDVTPRRVASEFHFDQHRLIDPLGFLLTAMIKGCFDVLCWSWNRNKKDRSTFVAPTSDLESLLKGLTLPC